MGRKQSKKTKRKLSNIAKRIGTGKWNKGRKQSEKTRRKLSIIFSGRKKGPMGEEHKRKISRALKGKNIWSKGSKKSKETCLKISKAFRGPKHPGWKGGISTMDGRIKIKEKIAGRKRPELCELCGKIGRICFDHDHKTGKFRGWICSKCNTVLGLIEDDKNILIKMINYLEQISTKVEDKEDPSEK